MSNIRRFDPVPEGTTSDYTMIEARDGEWVEYADYKELEALYAWLADRLKDLYMES